MNLEKRGLCKLCLQERSLRESHIFPRSYYKSLKSDSGQLIKVVVDEKSKPRKLNTNPHEHLLCQDCEGIIDKHYEKYGTRYFKNNNVVTECAKSITYNNFDYNKFYLYLISILWRASISSLDEFKAVIFPDDLIELLRQSIWSKCIKLKDNIGIDDFIKISVLRIIDKSGNMAQDMINNIFIGINFDRGENPTDGILYYYMIDGHFISYYLRPINNIQESKSKQIPGQLKHGTNITIPKVDICEITQIHESLSAAQRKSVDYKRSN